MLPQELIRRKRDGGTLTGAEIAALVTGLTDGSVSEGQIAAFAMAVFFRGLALDERVALTKAMRDSGTVLAWDLPGPVLDKHSSGGVGDDVSLMLAPMVAACGGFVPMISGRGLGHTGGTLDKLDSIPGYRTQPDNALFARVVREVGCAIIGQTADLAPADKRFYAIRDVTGTVESLDLITASILSKKLAAGLEGLVLDVKWGNGAFMATLAEAEALAASLVTVANGAGLPTRALVTDMNQPLAPAAGNALEIAHAVDFLTRKRRDPRAEAVTVALGAEMLTLSGLSGSLEEASARLTATLDDGRAAEVFGRMVAALGGANDFVETAANRLAAAPVVRDVFAEGEGIVESIDTRAVGVAVIELGGGRVQASDTIDPAVGFDRLAGVGERIDRATPIGRVHAATAAAAERAADRLKSAYRVGSSRPLDRPLVADRITE
ncbi:thymidine phosphorylase [Pinisolibacter aquiterrae]|uniref:thymidine phosphorylase n=1 Tax=Pinisolibacter aquiterrae TaxID=2815579 RepID=UPI001C3CCBA8|nr:thymidine phosphorylase [Pinisolibacter aquiterrae]MBV5266812.1 thymidine phosphorylase [Pinisolibacter aquiterrae]MCC8234874.1 thymidine phosphorylase [Pinisolibacter aquiterrae]